MVLFKNISGRLQTYFESTALPSFASKVDEEMSQLMAQIKEEASIKLASDDL